MLKRLSEHFRSRTNDRVSSALKVEPDVFAGNSPEYIGLLKRMNFNPQMEDQEFDAMMRLAIDTDAVSDEMKERLFNRYAIELPDDVTLFRGEPASGGKGARLGAPGPTVRGYAPTSTSESTARAFAENYFSNGRLAGALAEMQQLHPIKALPVPMSTESEFMLAPWTKKTLITESAPSEDALKRRLYYLSRKARGGQVNANH